MSVHLDGTHVPGAMRGRADEPELSAGASVQRRGAQALAYPQPKAGATR